MTPRPRGSWWTRPCSIAASGRRTSWPRSWPTSAAWRAAYVETAVAGQVFEDADISAGLLTRFDTLRNEALRGPESLALIERMCTEWTAPGARAVTQAPTAANA